MLPRVPFTSSLLPLHASSSEPPVTASLRAISIKSVISGQSIYFPQENEARHDIFSPQQATQLLLLRPWCAIERLPGNPLPHGLIYPLLLPQQKDMKECVEEELNQEFMHPTT